MDQAELNKLRESGRKLFNEQQYSEAIECFTKMIEMEESVSNYYQRATAFGCLMDRKKAIDDYSKVIELDETVVDAYLYRGMNRFKLDDFAKADSDFSKVIEFGGTDISFLYRGISRIRIRKETEALDDLNVFLEKEPNHAQALFHRGMTNRLLDNLGQAIADLSRVIELSNESDELYKVSVERRGKFYALEGEFSKSIEDLSKSINWDSNNVHALYYRGISYHNLEQNSAAIQDHARVKELDPDNRNKYHETLILQEEAPNQEILDETTETNQVEIPETKDDSNPITENNQIDDNQTKEEEPKHSEVSSQPIEDNPLEIANKHNE